jgi:hypothetical protein
VYQSLSVVNTVSEFFIALFPIIGAYTLGVDVRQRWHVISLLSLGFLVTIAGGFRTMFVWKCLVPYDGTWWVSAQWLCAEIEINLAMVRRQSRESTKADNLDLRLRRTSATARGTVHLPDKQPITNLDYAGSANGIVQVAGRRIDWFARNGRDI